MEASVVLRIEKHFQGEEKLTLKEIEQLVQCTMEYIENYPVTFPILHYFKSTLFHQVKIVNNIKGDFNVYLCLMFLYFKDQHGLKEILIDFSKGQTAKHQQDLIDYAFQMVETDIPDQDYQEEVKHLLQFLQTIIRESEEQTPAATTTIEKKNIFHECTQVREFRQNCRGRSWLSPRIYSILYVFWASEIPLDWEKLPISIIRHNKKEVQELIRNMHQAACPIQWRRIVEDITLTKVRPKSQLLLDLEKAIYTSEQSSTELLKQFVTLLQGNWDQCWSRCPWPKRRRIVRNIRQYLKERTISSEDVYEMMSDLLKEV